MLIKDLVQKHREVKQQTVFAATLLEFTGVGNRDVYNITAPFIVNGQEFIAGRVEERDSEFSKAVFFKKEADYYIPVEDAPVFDLQDPFMTFINQELVFGGVAVNPKAENPSELEWRTVLYRGKDIYHLEKFFEGPIGMKDLRLGQLLDQRILVLTRPQGEKGGRGKIGAFIIDNLSELTVDSVEAAPLLQNQFIDEEWGGGNEIHALSNESVGVLGHIANFDEEGNRHYYSMSFELNIDTFEISDVKIIAERADFKPSPAKRPDLEDVVFSGGIIIQGRLAELYCGISDASAQSLTIVNPFNKGE